MMVLGLVGQSGSGKSTVAKMFAELGAAWLDVDQVGRDVVKPGSPCLFRIAEEFGHDFLMPDGSLDRRRLGKVVFSNREKLLVLNSITHPAIAHRVGQWVEGLRGGPEPPEIAVLDAAVLFELGLDSLCDFIVLVKADPEAQARRIVERDGLSSDDARARIRSQRSAEDLEADADFVIVTDGTLAETMAEVAQVYSAAIANNRG